MILNSLIFHTVLIPLFATRVCASMFWVAVWAYCQQQGYFNLFFSWWGFELGIYLDFPIWLVQWPTLVVLGVLSYVEYRLENSPTWQRTVAQADGPLKGIANLFFSQWVTVKLSVASTAVLVAQAGFGKAFLFAIPTAIGVWVLASFRRSGFLFLAEMDEEDDLGIRKIFTQAEEAGIAITALVLLILPILAFLLALLAMGLMILIRVYVSHREQKIKIACPHCSELNHPAAPHCGHCDQVLQDAVGITLFNQPDDTPITDRVQHRLRLLVRRRCPHCATQLPKRNLNQACPTCGTMTFESRQNAKQLDDFLYWLFPKTLLIVSILGFIPLLGLIPGLMYYRLHLIAGYRAYLPRNAGCTTRFLARITTVLLIGLQSIPLIGAVSLPALCFLHTALYRASFNQEIDRTFPQKSSGDQMKHH